MNRVQCTDSVIMVRPQNFGYNTETADSNRFQRRDKGMSMEDIKKLARIEFDNFANELLSNGINVKIIEDLDSPIMPDAVFPNNWFSTHQEQCIISYAMFSKIRRSERREDVLDIIIDGRKVKRYKFEIYEDKKQYLEGTGSLVLDRKNKIAFASRSNRTDPEIFNNFCVLMGYQPVLFNAKDEQGIEIYHTNVLMMIGEKIAVICLDAIEDDEEKDLILAKFKESEHEIINISYQQMNAFAGNMLQLKNKDGHYKVILSRTAHDSLTPAQISRLKSHGDLIIGQIDTIERYGGGSVRCMLAEDFL